MSIESGKPQDAVRKQIGRRLADERDRVGKNQGDMAAALGVSKRAYAAWETGESAPGADDLAACHEIGVDVLFVVIGRRGGVLHEDETTLVNNYMKAAAAGRQALLQTAAALAEGHAPKVKSNVVQTFHGEVGQSVTGDINAPQSFDLGTTPKRKGRG